MSWLLPADHSVLKQTLRRKLYRMHIQLQVPLLSCCRPLPCSTHMCVICYLPLGSRTMTRTLLFYENGIAYDNAYTYKERKGFMTPEQLREAYTKYIDERKQSYVARMTNINASTLSSFKNGKFDLYPELHERLETFLNEHR